MTANKLTQTLVVLGLTWLFTASFYGNVLELGAPVDPNTWRPNVFESFQMDSEVSVTLMLERTKRDGLMSTGGFMMKRALDEPPYMSAWGLQGKILSVLYRMTTTPLDRFVNQAHFVVSLLFALLMAGFVVFAWREWGLSSAIGLALGTCMSPWLVFVARNLFHVYFLHLLPCVLSFACFPLTIHRKGFKYWHYAAIVSTSVLLNALCFLDYSSNIVLSTALGPIYFGIKARHPWQRTAKWMAIVLAASSLAVLGAIVATGIQAGIWMGSLREGFDQLISVAGSRMYSTALPGRAAPANVSVFQILDQFLTVPAINIPFDTSQPYRIYFSFFAAIAASIPLAMIAWLDGAAFPRIERERSTLCGLAAATLWGLGATLSWALIMKGHMAHHLHMNGLIFYLPYMLFLYILLGKSAALLTGSLFDRIRGVAVPARETLAPPPPARSASAQLKKKRRY